jgi:hypothetical protein
MWKVVTYNKIIVGNDSLHLQIKNKLTFNKSFSKFDKKNTSIVR